jgi:hypothetical protein
MSAVTQRRPGIPRILFSTAMGNDGGSIPDRRDLVRNKPKASLYLRYYLVVMLT